jgi:hypothetical protein
MLYGQLPYKEMKNINDVDNLKYEQLVFPSNVPVSNETKEFLRQSLSVSSNQRPSLLQLRNSSLLSRISGI